MNKKTIEAWKNASSSETPESETPPNPAGPSPLSDDDLSAVAGGSEVAAVTTEHAYTVGCCTDTMSIPCTGTSTAGALTLGCCTL